jgi:diguanylate cyclase (GGDEF)-like protein
LGDHPQENPEGKPMHRPLSRGGRFVLEEVTKQHHRSHLDDQVGVWLEQAEREQRRLAVLVMAADSLAWINRRWGRAAGDSVLRKLARRVAASLAPDDTFARFDGNRFGIVRWAASAEQALALAQHLLGRVAGVPFEIPGGRDAAFLTISVGMTVAGPVGDAVAIVAAAETALRQAKDGGGNRICTA